MLVKGEPSRFEGQGGGGALGAVGKEGKPGGGWIDAMSAEVAVKLISDKTFLIIMRVKVKVGGQDLVEFFYEVPFQQGQRELSTVCA